MLSGDDVRAAVSMAEAVEVVRGAFRALSAGGATVPLRVGLSMPDGVSLFMPAYLQGSAGAKVVSVHAGNTDRGLPVIHAVVLVLDPETGQLRALLDGTWLTALRTGAAGGVAADLLARPSARVATIFGAGAQARTQLQALRVVRPIQEVRLVSRSGSSAQRWADELQATTGKGPGGSAEGALRVRVMTDRAEAVAGADVVVAATDSAEPVFPGGAVEAGTHVTGVGSFTPEMREVDKTLLRRARIFVDERRAALEEAGELIQALGSGALEPGDIVGEIGAVVAGELAGRTSEDEITYFKSVGNAVQDVAVARRVLEVAEERGLGTTVRL